MSMPAGGYGDPFNHGIYVSWLKGVPIHAGFTAASLAAEAKILDAYIAENIADPFAPVLGVSPAQSNTGWKNKARFPAPVGVQHLQNFNLDPGKMNVAKISALKNSPKVRIAATPYQTASDAAIQADMDAARIEGKAVWDLYDFGLLNPVFASVGYSVAALRQRMAANGAMDWKGFLSMAALGVGGVMALNAIGAATGAIPSGDFGGTLFSAATPTNPATMTPNVPAAPVPNVPAAPVPNVPAAPVPNVPVANYQLQSSSVLQFPPPQVNFFAGSVSDPLAGTAWSAQAADAAGLTTSAFTNPAIADASASLTAAGGFADALAGQAIKIGGAAASAAIPAVLGGTKTPRAVAQQKGSGAMPLLLAAAGFLIFKG